MRYRVYSGPQDAPAISPLEKERMLFKDFTDLDGALAWSRHLESNGRAPLLIEGDDGTRMDKREIINALRVGNREQVGNSSDEVSPRCH